jgi:hypothetical protein
LIAQFLFHLPAGEQSRDGWDVPEVVLVRSWSHLIQPDAGHMLMLMLNDREAFVQKVEFCLT